MEQNNKNLMHFAGIILAAAVALAAGYYFGAEAEKTKAATSRAALVKEIFGPVLSIGNVFGKIIEIAPDKKSFVMEVPNVFQVNLPAEYSKKHIAIVSETALALFERKDHGTFTKEMEEFRKKQGVAKNGLLVDNSPVPYIEKEISSGDLKVGDEASVLFAPESGKNLLDNEFTAVHITVSR